MAVIRPPSSSNSYSQPGTGCTPERVNPSGTSTLTSVVGTSFSVGTETVSVAYSPAVTSSGLTTTCAQAGVDTATVRNVPTSARRVKKVGMVRVKPPQILGQVFQIV